MLDPPLGALRCVIVVGSRLPKWCGRECLIPPLGVLKCVTVVDPGLPDRCCKKCLIPPLGTFKCANCPAQLGTAQPDKAPPGIAQHNPTQPGTARLVLPSYCLSYCSFSVSFSTLFRKKKSGGNAGILALMWPRKNYTWQCLICSPTRTRIPDPRGNENGKPCKTLFFQMEINRIASNPMFP